MTQDDDHLRLLSIFHYVVGGMAGLFALFPLIHLFLGLTMIFRPNVFAGHGQAPPAFLGWFFVGIAVVLIVAGWIYAIFVMLTGRFLARGRRYTFCFVMACVDCLFMPFGTVLGVLTIVVLSRESVKQLFAAGA